MPKKDTSIDGFILRRRQTQRLDDVSRRRLGVDDLKVPDRFLHNKPSKSHEKAQSVQPIGGTIQRDIDASLKEIDAHQPKPKRKLFKHPRRKIAKRIAIAILVIFIAILGYLGIRALIASSNIFGGSIFDLFGHQPLKTDQYGRSNILLFGTSEDDPGHQGGSLTDSILVISVDQKKKNAFMFSVPRDLYVNYGQACPAGYEGKINALYSCASGGLKSKEAERQGQLALRKKIGEVYGMDLQYAVHVNYTVLRESVNAIGGIDVTINSRDPRGVLDRNFDWRCNYQCYLVKYSNGRHHLDGKHALFLAQARGDTAPTYGFEESNFDRERNQRKIIIAMTQKAKSAGVLANPITINKLIGTLGSNLRTNFTAGEVKTAIKLAGEINAKKVPSIDFYEEGNQLFTTGNLGGASVVMPTAGTYEYGEIHALINSYQVNIRLAQENATLEVLNGSEIAGAAQDKADQLERRGFQVAKIGNAPGSFSNTKVYQVNSKKPATKKQLEKLFHLKVTKKPPSTITSQADFVVVVGGRN